MSRLRTRLVAVAALSLLARLTALGARTAHWDEARVALRTLTYLETGVWSYDPLVHGPLLFHVNRVVFSALGPSDATARLVVAAVGGALPLAAWLYRDHLTPDEVTALAVLLAANPLLLFYGRFLRNDLPLAAAMLAAFGLLVRAHATGRRRYLVAAAPVSALGFALKENAVLYLACWVGAVAVVAAWRLRSRGESLRAAWDRVRGRLPASASHWGPWTAVSVVVWTAVVVLAYAPRDPDGLGLRQAVGDTALLPDLLAAATVAPLGRLVTFWVTGEGQSIGPRAVFYFVHVVGVLGVGALATTVLSVVGVATERDRKRPLVAVAVVWAVLSLLGYPLAMDLAAPWTAVHVVTPLAIPAAVGLAAAVDRARDELGDGGTRRLGRATAALLVLSAHLVGVAAVTSYVAPDHPFNPLAQPAQPGPDAGAAGDDLARATCGEAPVLFYGDYFYPEYTWRRLPLSWYVAAAGTESTWAPSGGFPAAPPPVVVALSTHESMLSTRLDEYDARHVELDPWVGREPMYRSVDAVVYVDPAAAAQCQSEADASSA